MQSFEEIGRTTGTDKIFVHGYHRFYPLFLEPLREKSFIMLEIGTDKNKSLALWKEYFPKATIYGIDIGNGFVHERGEVFKGDQSDTAVLNQAITRIGKKVQLIIDDGSHVPEHQLQTFIILFDTLLKNGGLYIIEDIETSYWRNGIIYDYPVAKGYKHKESIIEVFKDIIDAVNVEFVKDKSVFAGHPIPLTIQEKIAQVSFQHNCIIIRKKDANDIPYNKRRYRFEHLL